MRREGTSGIEHERPTTLLSDAARPFSVRGVALSALAALPTALSPVGPAVSWTILAGAGASVAYVLAASHVAQGRPGFLAIDTGRAPRSATLGACGRGFSLYLLAALPFVAFAAAAGGSASISSEDALAAMLATALYLPAALGAVVASGHPATAFWPFAWMKLIGAVGPATYARMSSVFAVTVVVAWGVGRAGDMLAAQAPEAAALAGAPVWSGAVAYAAARLAATTAENLVWFAQACALGHLLGRHRERLRLQGCPSAL
jgi:hypothetical protein